MTKRRCGHFRSHWTVVTDATGTWSIRYCDTCSTAVEVHRGAEIARTHQKAADLERAKGR